MKVKSLIPVSISDSEKLIGIKTYADTVVFDDDRNLVAMRFGGYPETVQAMADSVFGDCKLKLLLPDEKTETVIRTKGAKSYVRKVMHGTVYAEGFLAVKDDDRNSYATDSNDEPDDTLRSVYFFCKDESELYSELDRKLSVPLIPEFSDYFVGQLQKRIFLKNCMFTQQSRRFTPGICSCMMMNGGLPEFSLTA